MKKIFLLFSLVAITVTVTSCSNDDSSKSTTNNQTTIASGIFKMKINGIEKTFDSITVDPKVTHKPDQTTATLLKITAYNRNNLKEYTNLYALKYDAIDYNTTWEYTNNDNHSIYRSNALYGENSMSTGFSKNNGHVLVGAFSGTIVLDNGEKNPELQEIITITEGTLDIAYEVKK